MTVIFELEQKKKNLNKIPKSMHFLFVVVILCIAFVNFISKILIKNKSEFIKFHR
jgi:hypothetical protein